MQVDTSELRAIRDQVAALEAEVTDLRRAAVWTTALGDAIESRGYEAGRSSILGGSSGHDQLTGAYWEITPLAGSHGTFRPRAASRRCRRTPTYCAAG